MSKLFSPITLRQLTLPNRLVISPMCQYSAVDGLAQDWHLMQLSNLAFSGAGLVMIEATAVNAEGRVTPVCLGLWNTTQEVALKKVLDSVRQHSKVAFGLQLAHAGRKASAQTPWEGGNQIPIGKGGWQPLAPSPLPFHPEHPAPRALTLTEIETLPEPFVKAAERANRIGIEALELHFAHGYLFHSFLSPLSNQRQDQYGGSLENRMRLPLAVFDAVRKVWPAEKPLGVRISATDWAEGGWDLAQSLVFSKALKQRNCDWIDCSSGGLVQHQRITTTPGYQVPFAEAIRQQCDIPTMAVGMISNPEQAEKIIASGQADLVAVARAAIYDPRLGWHMAEKLGAKVTAPPQYWRGLPSGLLA